MTKWTKCAHRLPDTPRKVLIWIDTSNEFPQTITTYKGIGLGTYCSDGNWNFYVMPDKSLRQKTGITHWAELPYPPK